MLMRSHQVLYFNLGSTKMVLNEGMPSRRHHQPGNLFLVFDVVFPTQSFFSPANIESLKSLLPWQQDQPKSSAVMEALPVNAVSVSDRDIKDLEQEANKNDDDEDHTHGERVQCGQQ
eukprot:NODE_501_length_7561_cov_0.489547.p5 type:complete len:117 gc:universal NODE_501_length_7561_cov_0.489547:6150-5800(-)